MSGLSNIGIIYNNIIICALAILEIICSLVVLIGRGLVSDAEIDDWCPKLKIIDNKYRCYLEWLMINYLAN